MKKLVLGAFLLIMAFLSKESGVPFIGVIVLLFSFFANSNRKRSFAIIGVSGGIFLVYMGVRYIILGSISGTNGGITFLDNYLAFAPNYIAGLATELLIMGKYLALLLIPYPLISDYSFNTIPFTTLADYRVILSVCCYVSLMMFGVYHLVKRTKNPYAFGVLFYLTSMSIYTNIFFKIPCVMAERFLFYGAVGFCLIGALVIDRILEHSALTAGFGYRRKVVWAFVGLVCVCYTGITMQRNVEWRDNETLFAADVMKDPNNCRLLYNLGTCKTIASDSIVEPQLKHEAIAQGIGYLKKAAGIYPEYFLAYSEIANNYLKEGNLDSARVYAERALTLDAQDLINLNNLSAIYFKLGRFERSLDICKRIIRLDSTGGRGFRNSGNCYMRLNKFDSAIVFYKYAILLEPTVPVSYERTGMCYSVLGMKDSADKYAEIARTRGGQ